MRTLVISILLVGFANISLADAYEDFYKEVKNDRGMEAKRIPPKLAALFIDEEDYPEAVDVLGSLRSLKYLNYYGDSKRVEKYTEAALSTNHKFTRLGESEGYKKKVYLFGIWKKDFVKKIVAVVHKEKEFYLVIGKGKIKESQIALFPSLADEI
ncbi:MAG: DUF4252 domain-containing protein [Crocinitomicaceae bacterium]|nr:DUF4252 domain-containing protein [Crocinitomicaceae bacterium]